MTEVAGNESPSRDAGGKGVTEFLRLPPHCTIREIAAIRDLFSTSLLTAGAVQVNACDVERVDTAALQVFAAFARDRSEKGLSTTWSGCAENFARAASLLGLQNVIFLTVAPRM